MEKEKQNREQLLTTAHFSKADSTLEVREENGEMIVEGYAALYNSETNIGPFKETIAPGAFDEVLDNDVRALINHDPSLVLGRTTSGNLELTSDEFGLKYRVKLGNQQYAKDLYESVKRGDISQSSFAFTIEDQSWSEDRSTRTVEKVAQLLDVSPVTYPAYKSATAMARSEEIKEEKKEIREEQSSEKVEIKNVQKSKKMNLNEMKALRSKNYEEHVALVSVTDAEGREMTNEEEARADYLEGEISRLDNKLKRRQAHEEMIARQANFAGSSVSEAKEMDKTNRSFSLSRAIQTVSLGKGLEGAEAEWAQEAQKEMTSRGLQMTGQIGIPEAALFRVGAADNFQAVSGDGSGYVPTNVPGVIEALRAPTVIEQLGATTIHGATGNLKFPRVSKKAIATAETETSADANSTMELDELSLTPVRVANKTKFSKQLILQGGSQVDTLIASELQAGINTTIDKAAFAKVVAGLSMVAGAGGLTAANLFGLEKSVLAEGGNMANCKWAMNPAGWAASRDLATVDSINAFWSGQSFDGFPAVATPNIAEATTGKGDILFGDWAAGLILVFFGGLDLLVDPYSDAGTAQIALHLNKFYDCEVRQAGAFAGITNVA
jgi:HK97 family phage prohead protease/HK97 family phage major capsid protein